MKRKKPLRYVEQDFLHGRTVKISLRMQAEDRKLVADAVAVNLQRAGKRLPWPRPANMSALCRRWILDGARALMGRTK
jgi:hypothetical protein